MKPTGWLNVYKSKGESELSIINTPLILLDFITTLQACTSSFTPQNSVSGDQDKLEGKGVVLNQNYNFLQVKKKKVLNCRELG